MKEIYTDKNPNAFADALEADEDVEIKNSTPVCDFCNSTDPRWEYPCKDFNSMTTVDVEKNRAKDWTMNGAWLACDLCHELIEANNYEGLAERSAEKLILKENLPQHIKDQLVTYLKSLQMTFRLNRLGEGVKWEPNKERVSQGE